MNTKRHAIADANGRPLKFFMSAGEVSDYTGAAALLGHMPSAEWLLADRGYDADWYREALKDKGIRVCIPGRENRKKKIRFDRRRYKRRSRIEIMFGNWIAAPCQSDSAISFVPSLLIWFAIRENCQFHECAVHSQPHEAKCV